MSGKIKVALPERLQPVFVNYNKTARCAVVTNDGSKYYDNNTFFDKIIDLIVESVDINLRNEIIKVFEEANVRYLKKKERRIFYLCENELADFWNSISDSHQKPIYTTDVSEASRSLFDTITECNLWDILLKKEEFRSLDECASFDVIKKLTRENSSDPDNGDKMLIFGQKPFVYYTEALIAMQNIETFSQKNPKRRIVLRTMCEWRITNTDYWHLFSNEASQGSMIALKQADKWENEVDFSALSEKSYAITSVIDFQNSCNSFGINADRFLLVPDIQFAKNWFELPLDMSYQCAWVNASDGEKVYHQSQAMYLITQRVAANIIGLESMLCSPTHATKELFDFKSQILNEMDRIGLGYITADKVEHIIGKLTENSVYLKNQTSTALFECSRRPCNVIMETSEFMKYVYQIETAPSDAIIVRCKMFNLLGIGENDLPEALKIWKVRHVFMYRLIGFFLFTVPHLQTYVLQAWTLNITQFKIEKLDDFLKMRKTLERALDEPSFNKNRSIHQFGSDEMMKLMTMKIANSEILGTNKLEVEQVTGENEKPTSKEQVMSEKSDITPKQYQETIEILTSLLSDRNEELSLLKMDLHKRNIAHEDITKAANKEKRVWYDKHATVLAENVNLKESMSERGTRINELQRELKRMKGEAKSERAKAEQATQNIKSLEKELHSIKSSFGRMTTELENIEKREKMIESDAKSMKNEFGKMTKQLDTMKKENIDLEEELERKTSILERTREEYEKDRIENARVISTLTNDKDQLMLRVEELTESSAILLSQNNRDAYVSQLEGRLAMVENWYRRGLDCFDTPPLTIVPPMETIDNQEFSASTSTELSMAVVERCALVEQRMGEYDEILTSGYEELIALVENNVKTYAGMRGRHRSANNELLEFKKTFNTVIDATKAQFVVAQNDITIRIDDLSDHMKFPKFSDRFMQTYEKLMKNKQNIKVEQKTSIVWKTMSTVDNEKIELEDHECLICTEEMEGNDPHLTKCPNCSRVYHTKCLTEWLQHNSTCPVCRNSLPDPESFPFLN